MRNHSLYQKHNGMYLYILYWYTICILCATVKVQLILYFHVVTIYVTYTVLNVIIVAKSAIIICCKTPITTVITAVTQCENAVTKRNYNRKEDTFDDYIRYGSKYLLCPCRGGVTGAGHEGGGHVALLAGWACPQHREKLL